MSNPAPMAKQVAAAVQQAITDSGRTKLSVSEETGIPYATLNRKLAAKTDFTFRELLALAEVLKVSPAQFTPSPFRTPDETAKADVA